MKLLDSSDYEKIGLHADKKDVFVVANYEELIKVIENGMQKERQEA